MINRRQFIKGSGIATVGALTLGFNKKSDATKLPQVSGKSIK